IPHLTALGRTNSLCTYPGRTGLLQHTQVPRDSNRFMISTGYNPSMFKVLSTPCLFQVLLLIRTTSAAFTVPTSDNENTVQTDAAGTWCYYPQSGQTTSTTCGGNF